MDSVLDTDSPPEEFATGGEPTINRYGFTVNNHQLLLPENYRAELIELPTISPIANTPSHYLGVCNLRGNLIPCYQLTSSDHKYLLIIGEQEPAAIAIDSMAKRFIAHLNRRQSAASNQHELFIVCGKNFYDAGDQIEIAPEEFFKYLSNYRDDDLLKQLAS